MALLIIIVQLPPSIIGSQIRLNIFIMLDNTLVLFGE